MPDPSEPSPDAPPSAPGRTEAPDAPDHAPLEPKRPPDSLIRYYDDVQISSQEGTFRLDYQRTAHSPPPTAGIRALQAQIEDVERMVNLLFPTNTGRKERFFAELHLTAFSGFVGDDYDLAVGADNLQSVKNHIADVYPQVREPIWRANLTMVVSMIVVTGVAVLVYHQVAGAWLPPLDAAHKRISGLLMAIILIPLGCAAGLFVEFLFRVNDDIPYDQLRAINPGRWTPWSRAVNTLLIAYMFAALLAIDLIQVGISGTLLNTFKDGRPELAVAIGFVTGFAFPYVRDLLQQVRPEARPRQT